MKKNKGVTLIELIISIIMFSVIILGIAMFNSQNTKAALRSERNAKMTIMQENIIEEYKGFLKAAPVAGERFDNLWQTGNVGDVLATETDAATGITVSLEIESFEPDQATPVTADSVFLKLSVVSTDNVFGINKETTILISRHD